MLKWWPTLLLSLAAFSFFDYYSLKEPKKYTMLNEGCLVESLYFQQAVHAKEKLEGQIWSRVLCIHFYGTITGHAVTVFIHKNITWVYDPNRGSFVVANYPLYDPFMIAEICFPKLVIRKAFYIEPTLLLHYQPEPSKLGW
jgi:uncharacterized membrane protein YoaT (DUF817 family)